jgi:hypothetical protein
LHQGALRGEFPDIVPGRVDARKRGRKSLSRPCSVERRLNSTRSPAHGQNRGQVHRIEDRCTGGTATSRGARVLCTVFVHVTGQRPWDGPVAHYDPHHWDTRYPVRHKSHDQAPHSKRLVLTALPSVHVEPIPPSPLARGSRTRLPSCSHPCIACIALAVPQTPYSKSPVGCLRPISMGIPGRRELCTLRRYSWP